MKTIAESESISPGQTAPVPGADENGAQIFPSLHAGGPTASPTRLAYSVREVAEILGVSEKTVRRLIDRGLLRVSRALRHLLIPKKEVERFLEETTG